MNNLETTDRRMTKIRLAEKVRSLFVFKIIRL